MIKEDFIIQSEVRRMLIRTNIDYTKIDFGTVRGVVYLRGMFQTIHPPTGDEEARRAYDVKTLFSFEKKIRSISGVSDVIFQFINWKRERGQWIPTRPMKKEGQRIEQREGSKEEKKEKKNESETDPGV
jgi:hypothetical protein